MVKAYLRYEFQGAFGVVTSGAPSCFDASGKLLITSALENVAAWNIKQGTQVRARARWRRARGGLARRGLWGAAGSIVAVAHCTCSLSQAKLLVPGVGEASSSTTSTSAPAEVTCIARAPGASQQIAVGYADGAVRACHRSRRHHQERCCTPHAQGRKASLAAPKRQTQACKAPGPLPVALARLHTSPCDSRPAAPNPAAASLFSSRAMALQRAAHDSTHLLSH